MVAGAILLDTILRRLDAEELTLCDLALREGLVIDYVRRHKQQIAQADLIPDVRRRSTIELAERCNYYAVHAQQVARLALALFDQTRATHGLTDREREWLEYASLMHDLGVHISYPRHHRHSYYLIKNGDLRGFEPEEIEVMALVARYHRRGTPKKTHEEYARLRPPLRRTVRLLASILRLAESLDRSHAQVVSALELQDRGKDMLLELRAAGDAELEVWAAHRHVQPFEELMEKPVRLALQPQRNEMAQRAKLSRRASTVRSDTRPASELFPAWSARSSSRQVTNHAVSPSRWPPLARVVRFLRFVRLHQRAHVDAGYERRP